MSIQHGFPIWVIGFFILICLFSALELGYRIGYSRRDLWKDIDPGGRHIILTSTFALLGLMLAFTYGAGLSRYDASKKAILQEANGIHTVYLYADMIADPDGAELKEALHSYARTLVIKKGEADTTEELETLLRESSQAQTNLLTTVQKIIKKEHFDPQLTPLLITSVKNVIHSHTNRVSAFVDKLPTAVLIMLLFVASASVSIAGFNAGIKGKMGWWGMATFIFILMGVMIMIHDYDHPSGGFIQIDQSVMYDTLEEIESELYTE